MVCPNGKRFYFLRTAQVKGNQYGRTEEYYQCEDCESCSHREECHKSSQNRVVRINAELTRFHEEVLGNLNSVHGALLRMNRSIQSEGAFGGDPPVPLGLFFYSPFIIRNLHQQAKQGILLILISSMNINGPRKPTAFRTRNIHFVGCCW